MFVLEYDDDDDDDDDNDYDTNEDGEEPKDDGEMFADISDWTKISCQELTKYSLLRTC